MKSRRKVAENALTERALKLVEAGLSVIPVMGDRSPREPKKPALRWRRFQKRIASPAEAQEMFGGEAGALGIVCGRVSQLLVVDFDDHLRYRRFCRHLPQYSDSYTVKTRRGFHVYFRTAERVPSHQFDGGDIKGEKSYVVAAPSKIGGFGYRCVNDRPRLELGKEDIDRILNYFHVKAAAQPVPGERPALVESIDVAVMYARLAPEIGRNNALYRSASVARDGGWARKRTEECLIGTHIEEAAGPGHKAELPAERLREAVRTIESAYRSEARQLDAKAGIPNSVREALLQSQGSTVVARLLDAMWLAGWRAESRFTMGEAVALAREYGLNRKSVLQALTGDRSIFNGRQIISRRYVEYLDTGGQKGRKRGRPVELVFETPSVGRLLEVVNAPWSPSDALHPADLAAASAYRMALHREYIRRLKPRIALAVLAQRIGVNERTIRRYNEALGVKARECVGFFELARDRLACLPKRRWRAAKNATSGFWLELKECQRFPAWRHIGARLLKEKAGKVRVCLRRASSYSIAGADEAGVEYERMSEAEFARALRLRGVELDAPGMVARVGELARRAGERVASWRYERIQLEYESVARCIAEDKVAETINGYLVAEDAEGAEVRRPALRGVAYRMLKEFGNGNVFLALRLSLRETIASVARQIAGEESPPMAMDLMARALA